MSALRDNTIAFIGSGTMAEAMMKGILTRQLITPEKITGSGPRVERGEKLTELYGIQATTDNASAAEAGTIVVVAPTSSCRLAPPMPAGAPHTTTRRCASFPEPREEQEPCPCTRSRHRAARSVV